MCLMVRVASVSTEPLSAACAASSTTPRSSRRATPRSPPRRPTTRPGGTQPYADLVGTFVVRDTDLPALKATPLALSVVVTGAPATSPAAPHSRASCTSPSRASRSRCATSTTWPATPAGSAAAVDAARDEGQLDDHVPVYVELPAHGRSLPGGGLAGGGRRGRGTGVPAEVPHRRAGRRGVPLLGDAGRLDRRGARPGDAVQVHRRAAPRGAAHRRRTASSTTASSTCSSRPGRPGTAPRATRSWPRSRSGPATRWTPPSSTGARRWFTSFGSCSVSEPLDDLITLGLLEKP